MFFVRIHWFDLKIFQGYEKLDELILDDDLLIIDHYVKVLKMVIIFSN